jgi:hypothetical protein
MQQTRSVLDEVRLAVNLPGAGLAAGERGTVVQVLSEGSLLVEFLERTSCTHMLVEVREAQVEPGLDPSWRESR